MAVTHDTTKTTPRQVPPVTYKMQCTMLIQHKYTLKTAAEYFNMSDRTLLRRLKAEGYTWKQLRQEVLNPPKKQESGNSDDSHSESSDHDCHDDKDLSCDDSLNNTRNKTPEGAENPDNNDGNNSNEDPKKDAKVELTEDFLRTELIKTYEEAKGDPKLKKDLLSLMTQFLDKKKALAPEADRAVDEYEGDELAVLGLME